MQLIASGPDIPDTLLQAHEEGRVVFFCGAGISRPAGLPAFKGLVDAIYKGVGDSPIGPEKAAYERKQYDVALGLLEHRITGQHRAVRESLAKALQPKRWPKGATDTHEALLHLAHDRERKLRLVTTNFDLLFEKAVKRLKRSINTFAAPMLPVPKNRWNGLVYLHGILPSRPDADALNRLVVTSGGFGLAYLTERWAARFVSELFRNYVVCFVGYSIDDPVLRYMMDALAADRMLGEVTPQAFAFGDYSPDKKEQKQAEWESKGVTPILYETPSDEDHSALHRSLKTWADVYRDGILGKERIVLQYALARPSGSTPQDDFVGRMLWALSDRTGLPAKRFAEFVPAPPLDWLEAFSKERYRHADLLRFGVPPQSDLDDSLQFSFIDRPTPYPLAPQMTVAPYGLADSRWDAVMFHLAGWLVRHLNNPKLILWLAKRGGRLHGKLAGMVERKLDELARLERDGKSDELDSIRKESPDAIPWPVLRPLWRLFVTNTIQSARQSLVLYRWKDNLRREGLTASMRLQLRQLLAPKVMLREPLRWGRQEHEDGEAVRLRDLVDWELVLAADNVRHFLDNDVRSIEQWPSYLASLLEDFQQLLRDALDLRRELGEDDREDLSHWDLPSIGPHWQNRKGHRDWVALVELLRDAWLAVWEDDPARAAQVAQGWFLLPYAYFKRLALFAASHDGCIPPEQWVEWLVSEDAWCLWEDKTKRESLRLIVLQGSRLTSPAQARLETAILSGPPRGMYREGLSPEVWKDIVDDSVWLRLAKLQASEAQLGPEAAARLKALSAANPAWRLAEDERDEFASWMSGTGDPGFKDFCEMVEAPRGRAELAEWLRKPPPAEYPRYQDDWKERCRTDFDTCAGALQDVAADGEWPAHRWREALQAWQTEDLATRSWDEVHSLVEDIPENVLKDIVRSVSSWLKVLSKSLQRHESVFLELCRRILELPSESEDLEDPVFRAINHPVGHVTEAMLNLWFNRKPNDGDGIPEHLKPIFTELCDIAVPRFRHGRVLLASRVIPLFRVDRAWTEAHLLPFFDWTADSGEAQAVWRGFLWSPRIYDPLLTAIQRQFLGTTSHYRALGESAENFIALLTFAALEPPDGYETKDLRCAFAELPQEGLDNAARMLVQALDAADNRREDYWTYRIRPFWQDIWPKSLEHASKKISDSLAQVCILTGGCFPEAVEFFSDWLMPVDHLDVVDDLSKSGLPKQFPEPSLRLLDAIVKNQQWPPNELKACLEVIGSADSTLMQDHRYKRLIDYSRLRGL